MKIVLITEDSKTGEAIRILAEKSLRLANKSMLLDRRWRDRGEIFNPKKIAAFVNFVSLGQATKIIICVDSECTAPEITERNWGSCKKAIRDLKIKTPVDFLVIVHALETWLAADEEALHAALNAKKTVKTPGNLEMECRPASILKEVYRKNGKEFLKSKDDLIIAEHADPARIASVAAVSEDSSRFC